MINHQFQALDPGEGGFKLFPDIFLVIGEFPAQVFADHPGLLPVGDQADPAENHDTVYVQRPFAFPAETGIKDAVAYLVTGGQGVDLMTGPGTVEIQFSIRGIIPVIHGNTVGITILAVHGKDAPFFLLQDPETLRLADLLFKPSHFPE